MAVLPIAADLDHLPLVSSGESDTSTQVRTACYLLRYGLGALPDALVKAASINVMLAGIARTPRGIRQGDRMPIRTGRP